MNSIVHPAIFAAWCCRTQEIKELKPEAIILSDAPLLIEEGMQSLFDLVMLIYVSRKSRTGPAHEAERLEVGGVLHSVKAQMPIDDKLPVRGS